MRGITAATLALALLAGCDGSSDKNEPGTATGEQDRVVVEDAWVRLPAAPGRPGAAYFTLDVTGRARALDGITSPRVERIELHAMVERNSVSHMDRLSEVPAQDGVIGFGPGGKHAMLFGIDPAVKAGDRIALTFALRPGPPITADAEVHAAGSAPHSGH